MAKEPKLDYDVIETLYQYGYNTKEIAKLVNSVNGHISKVLRGLGIQMRKRGEIVDKTNFYDMDSEAQTLLKGLKTNLDEIYDSWFQRPSVQKRLTGVTVVSAPIVSVTSEEAVESTVEAVEEVVDVESVLEEVSQGETKVEQVQEIPAIEEPQEEQVQEVPTVEEPQEEQVQGTQEDKYQLEEEKTEEGYTIVRGDDFKGADLQVQGAIIKHFMNQGMAQRPIATEIGIAQSNISRIWTKYRKAYVK
ncbi:hypothetical protein CN495_08955 [Bacillus thuringiensis]|uniref:Uncharacterized protein n=1 Tax=Bacillus thuringiensis TaxID=1428 RepID=A0ABD6SAA6_BACTU|nr:hypothetical protein [Bacillus thuringiensis]PER55870.1 hypothetical protein CN495_08955 [Bacillus thuringiensis]